MMTQLLRASLGTLSLLGLHKAHLDVPPTTLYLLLGASCTGACCYCTQKQRGNKYLARVQWPPMPLEKMLPTLKTCSAKRICIQTLKYPHMLDDLLPLIPQMQQQSLPLSICTNPLPFLAFHKLKSAGVERVGIGLDCASKKLFHTLKKGVGTWDDYLRALDKVHHVFGEATAHLIVGLGETDYEILSLIQMLHGKGISTALFAYTPLRSVQSPLPLERYRALQVSRFLIQNNLVTLADMDFVHNRLASITPPYAHDMDPIAFQTSGCPDCNRPFYNESVRGPLYNYPRALIPKEYKKAKQDVEAYLSLQEKF